MLGLLAMTEVSGRKSWRLEVTPESPPSASGKLVLRPLKLFVMGHGCNDRRIDGFRTALGT